MYNRHQREQKAKKILAVLSDFMGEQSNPLKVLDIGCSAGIITRLLAAHFALVVGMDLDEEAISFAENEKDRDNLAFFCGDALHLPFREETFDLLVC